MGGVGVVKSKVEAAVPTIFISVQMPPKQKEGSKRIRTRSQKNAGGTGAVTTSGIRLGNDIKRQLIPLSCNMSMNVDQRAEQMYSGYSSRPQD